MQLMTLMEGLSDDGAPPPSPMTTSSLVVAFTDLKGSTGLARSLGDRRWVALLDAHDETVRFATLRHRGRVVKAMGDGMLAVFAGASDALRWAVELQHDMRALARSVGVEPLGLRIGLHAGPVVHRRGDVAGLTVHVASRITAVAAAGEVLASSIVRRRAQDADGIRFGGTRQLHLRDLDGVQVLHQLDWTA